MVKNKLDIAPNGWLLDGYPRSLSQAEALEALDIHPQIFILLEASVTYQSVLRDILTLVTFL